MGTSVETSLTALLKAIRAGSNPGSWSSFWTLPEDLRTEQNDHVTLDHRQGRARSDLRDALSQDLRFEYLSEAEADDAAWRFAFAAHDPSVQDVARDFVQEYGREIERLSCSFNLEALRVPFEFELHGATLGPQIGSTGDLEGSVITVPTSGTKRSLMAERGRRHAQHVLRVLRAALREHRGIADEQLRFVVGEDYTFEDGHAGWRLPPGTAWELELGDATLAVARAAALYELPPEGRNDVERQANLALQWFEEAQLSVSPLIRLLHLFSALEAILGDSSAGLKARNIALRRAMLGALTEGSFTNPDRTYYLYDKVRSAAVHGKQPPTLAPGDIDSFSWDVRRALNEFLTFARTKNLTKRKQVRAALDEPSDQRLQVLDAMAARSPRRWTAFAEAERVRLGRPPSP